MKCVLVTNFKVYVWVWHMILMSSQEADDGGGKSVKILLKVWSSNSVGDLCANPQNLIITQKLMKMHAPPQSHFY